MAGAWAKAVSVFWGVGLLNGPSAFSPHYRTVGKEKLGLCHPGTTLERAGITSRAKEGAERPGKAEYRQFLGYAKGSAGELQTQIIIAGELDYLPADQARRMVSECIELSKMLWGLIRSMS